MAFFDRRGRWSCGATNSYEEHCGVRSRRPACRKCFEISSLGRSICMSPPKDTEDIMVLRVQSNFSKGFQDCSTFSIEPNPSCKWGKLGFLLFQGWQAEIYQARSYMHIIWLFVGNVAGFLCNFCSLTLHKGSFILLLFNKVKVTCTFTDYIHRNM